MAAAPRLLEALRAATVGEYEIRGEIGRGGMAAVYLAYDLRLNRKVAMKVMLPELAYYEGMEERFKREARTAAKLDHPNIVVIYSVRDDAELLFFVMKYIEGASLDQLTRVHAQLPIPVAQHALAQLASALQYAHDEGVVHRDVKPGNVLIDLRGNVLVTDFGIAKATEAPHLTRTGSVIGTPTYMSPEQCLGSEQTHASDQYSLGIVAYEIIAGRPPFVGSTVEKQWAHVKVDPEPLAALRPDCPPELAAAVMRMLAKDASDRWPTLRHSIPALASGLLPGDDTPRKQLADLVRLTAPGFTHDFAITPASPLPQPSAPPAPKHVWTSLAIAPAAAAIELGASVQLAVTFSPPADPPLTTPAVTWSSSAESIVSVSETGLATARGPGAAVIIAHAGTLAAACTVSVGPARVAAIQISPPTASLEVGTTVPLQATLRDAKGNSLANRAVSWSSTDPSVSSVSPAGLVTANALGTATITAASDTVTASAAVRVVPDTVAALSLTPPSLSLTERTSERVVAVAMNRRGRPVAGRRIEWRAVAPAVADVTPDGLVDAKSPGRTTISATADGCSATVDVVVRPADVGALWVTPTAPTITAGDRLRFAAEVRDRDGHVLSGRAIVWRSADPSTVTVDGSGMASGIKPGIAAVTAECGGVVAAVHVSVVAPVIAKLDIEARAGSLRAGKRMRLRVTATDLAGREIALPDVTWRSSDPQIASVEGDGTLVALREGSVTVTASVLDRQAHATIAIAPPVATARLMRASLAGAGVVALVIAGFVFFPRGDESAATVAGSRADTTQRTPEPPAGTTPTPPNDQQTAQAEPTPAPGTPAPAGEPAPAAGPAVAPAGPTTPPTAVATLRVTSQNPVSIEAGEQSRVVLRASTSDGDLVPRPRIRWSAANPTIISVTPDGLITGLTEGRTAATASADGATARVEVVVRRPAAGRVAISPRPRSLRVGQETRLGAGVFSRRGSTLDGPVTWQSSNAGVATVDNAGTVRAIRAGEVTISANAGSVADSVRLTVAAAEVVTRPDPQPSPVTPPPAPTPSPATPNAEATRAAARAAAETAVGTEAQAVAEAVGGAMPRGQLGPVSPTGQFARFVRDNTPEVVGAHRLSRQTISDSTAEAVITLPLRWRDFTGRVRTGSVDVLVSLAMRDGTWRRTAARNLNTP